MVIRVFDILYGQNDYSTIRLVYILHYKKLSSSIADIHREHGVRAVWDSSERSLFVWEDWFFSTGNYEASEVYFIR